MHYFKTIKKETCGSGQNLPTTKCSKLIAAERSRSLPHLCTYSRGNAIGPYYRYSLVAPPILTLCHGQLLPFYIYIYSQNIIIKILVFSSYFKIINIYSENPMTPVLAFSLFLKSSINIYIYIYTSDFDIFFIF